MDYMPITIYSPTSVVDPDVSGVIELFGGEVDDTDAGCLEGPNRVSMTLFISRADSSIDASGALHVRTAPRYDSYVWAPEVIFPDAQSVLNNDSAWGVDLTVTSNYQLVGMLSLVPSSRQDASAVQQEQTLAIEGPLTAVCASGVTFEQIAPSGGGAFTLPCSSVPLEPCGQPPRM